MCLHRDKRETILPTGLPHGGPLTWRDIDGRCIGRLPICRRRTSDVRIETQIQPQPVKMGNEIVTVHITARASQPVAGAHVQIEADMNHPGMAPVFADAQERATGTYVAQLNLNMPGDWVVIEQVHLTNGKQIERQVDVRGVSR